MIKKDHSGMKTLQTKCSDALWNKYREDIVPVIPDIKLKSPGEGKLLFQRNPIEYAKVLEAAGAPVISVVTEAEHYGGSVELLFQIAQAVSVPILRKDFITTKKQLKESLLMGASGVLLISAIMKEELLQELVSEAIKLGLEPLVETHNEEELKKAKKMGLTFLGINNKNILEWEVDEGNVKTTEKLAALITNTSGSLAELAGMHCFILSESSISSQEDILRAIACGCHGVLVGTAILKATNPVEMFKKLSIPYKLTNHKE